LIHRHDKSSKTDIQPAITLLRAERKGKTCSSELSIFPTVVKQRFTTFTEANIDDLA